MISFYYNLSPNPMKVALFLEEAGLDYEPCPVDTRLGQQSLPSFLALNPNGKVPVIVDGATTVFDSNAILLYLGGKTGKFMPEGGMTGELLSWMMFIASGLSPFSGQAVHFRHFAPVPVPYAQNRYSYEAVRHYRVVEQRLAGRKYMLGDAYTIVDMALWGWAQRVPFIIGDDAWAMFPNVKALCEGITARPAAQRALALKDRHAFKAELDAEARDIMYPQNVGFAAAPAL